MSRGGDERPGNGPIGGRGLSGAMGGGLARLERQERRAASASATQGRARLGLRLSVVGVISLGLLSVLLVRLWTVQVIDHHAYFKGAKQELYTTIYTPAPRGEIVARDGSVLATDTAENVVTVARAINPLTGDTYVAKYPVGEANLSALLGLSTTTIDSELNSLQVAPHEPAVVAIGTAQGVTEQAVVQISENPGRYPGVTVSRQYVRSYPEGDLATQILGYTGSSFATVGYDAKGRPLQSSLDQAEYTRYNGPESAPTFGEDGLEEQYQQYLFGTPGTETQVVDPSGNPVGTSTSSPPVQGDTVVLNLDLGLEQALWSALVNQVAALRSGAASGAPVPAPDASAVVLDARTGAVLAIASYPSYNDNEWVGGISTKQYDQLLAAPGHPLDDYAVANPQPPGSDFKLASATAALDDNLISPYSTFDDTGQFTYGNTTLHDNIGDIPFGPIDVSQALTVSSDTFFYWVGASFWQLYQNTPKYPYGDMPIQTIAHDYGLGVQDGIDLPPLDVASGQIDSPQWRIASGQGNNYTGGDNMEMAFGQAETEITPLELATAYATFADHGVRHAPELAREIVSPTGKLVRAIAPQVTGHVGYASQADYDALLSGFEGVTQQGPPMEGTGYTAFQGFDFKTWNVAGKTGTATTSAIQGVQPTSWFVGFGGPRAQPNEQYVVAVQVNQGGYGATASAPVARDVFDYLYHHGVAPVAP